MTTKTQGMIQLGRKDTGLQWNRASSSISFLVRGVAVFTATSTGISFAVNPAYADDILPDATDTRTLGSSAARWLSAYVKNLFLGATAAIVAHSGGGQASATALTTGINRVGTVAAAADSVKLPAALAGAICIITNAGAFSMQVFGAGTDTINSIATATGIPHPVGASRLYSCAADGNWDVSSAPSLLNQKYSAATNTTAFTATGAQVAGADTVTLNCTGTLGSGQALTLPIATDLVAAIPNAYVGQTYRLRIMNQSSANFAWTVTTASGLTLTGTMTIGQNTYRDFVVTLTSLTAVAIQSLGQVIVAA